MMRDIWSLGRVQSYFPLFPSAVTAPSQTVKSFICLGSAVKCEGDDTVEGKERRAAANESCFGLMNCPRSKLLPRKDKCLVHKALSVSVLPTCVSEAWSRE